MLQFIDAPDDVIALKVSDRLTAADMDAIMDRLDPMMAGERKVHVFVETHSIHSIEVGGLPSYTARAMPLIGKLNRFGRVAVVADQAWIRFWTRLESAMLPFVSYRVFLPEQRDEALSWVKGEQQTVGA